MNTDPFDPDMAVLPQVPRCRECRYYLYSGRKGERFCRHIEFNKDRAEFLRGVAYIYAENARRWYCEDDETKIPKFFKPAPPKLGAIARFFLWCAKKCGAR